MLYKATKPGVVFGWCYGTVVLSVCNVGVLWPNGWADQDATWYIGRPRSKQHCVRWAPSSPHGKGHCSPPPPLFGPCLLWPNGHQSQQLLSSCYGYFVSRHLSVYFQSAFVVFSLVSSVQCCKWLAGNSISEMTYVLFVWNVKPELSLCQYQQLCIVLAVQMYICDD